MLNKEFASKIKKLKRSAIFKNGNLMNCFESELLINNLSVLPSSIELNQTIEKKNSKCTLFVLVFFLTLLRRFMASRYIPVEQKKSN